MNKSFTILFSQMNKNAPYPFKPEEEGLIRENMKDNYDKILESVKDFKKNIEEINDIIKTFRISLDYLIGYGSIGIKGKCYIEKDLYPFDKIKCRFSKYLSSVLTSTIYSRLQSLSHISLRVSFLSRLGVRGYIYGISDNP